MTRRKEHGRIEDASRDEPGRMRRNGLEIPRQRPQVQGGIARRIGGAEQRERMEDERPRERERREEINETREVGAPHAGLLSAAPGWSLRFRESELRLYVRLIRFGGGTK